MAESRDSDSLSNLGQAMNGQRGKLEHTNRMMLGKDNVIFSHI